MSLLLDALQRASKEKEKATAATTPSNPPAAQPPLDMALEPALPPSPSEPPSPPPVRPAPAAPEIPASPDTPLEFSFTPTPVPAPVMETAKPPAPEKIEPTLASVPPATPQAMPAPVPELAPAAPSKPISEPPAPPPTTAPTVPPVATTQTKAASPERPVPQLSPQVAREILYASTGNNKPKANKRLIAMIGFAVVLALSFGSLFLFQHLNTPSGLAPPQLAQTPPTTTPSQTTGPTPITAVETAASPATAPAETPSAKPIATDTVKASDGAVKTAAEPQKNLVVAQPKEETPAAPASSKPLFIAKATGSGPLDAAYAALNEGRLGAASEAYRRILKNNPDERDALLGLAYIAHRQARHDEARTYYQAVLRQEPDHPVANAGLLALTSTDSENTVSRARDMADKNPESAAALSALGSALAREGLIADAQQAFFKAAALEPESPLHAYNLAVALDRLHKHDLAKNYYERALALADKASPGLRQNFPREAAINRLEQLRSRSASAQ